MGEQDRQIMGEQNGPKAPKSLFTHRPRLAQVTTSTTTAKTAPGPDTLAPAFRRAEP